MIPIIAKVIGKLGGDAAKVWIARKGDKTQIEGNAHTERMTAMKADMINSYGAANRNWLDSIIDAFSRLPRPMIGCSIAFIFNIIAASPLIQFIRRAVTYEEMIIIYEEFLTDNRWLVMAVITFYFGARYLEKKHKSNISMVGAIKKSDPLPVPETVDHSAPAVQVPEIKITYDPTCSGILSNEKTMDMVKRVGAATGTDHIVVTGADRSREVHRDLVERKKTKTKYRDTQHSRFQGFKAADIECYKDGVKILPLTVAKAARDIPAVGGVGVYNSFTHCDIRDRKEDGSISKWGNWS